MSYGIIRIQKYGAGSCGGIQIHDRRMKGYSHTNKDINFELSHLNYNLHHEHDEKKSFRTLANERISELGLARAVRKDAIVMAQALVTSDNQFFKDLSQKEQERFFRDSYEFLCRKYGEENCISAYVHLDETTPHMHFNFVPVTDDGRLSAKRLFTPTTLRGLQDEFYQQVGQGFGLERGEIGSKTRHQTVLEYKISTAKGKLEDVETEIELNIKNEQNLTQELQDVLNHVQEQISGLNDEIDSKEKQLKSLVSRYKESEVERNTVREIDESKKTGLGGRITLRPEKYEKLRQIAINSLWYKNELQGAEMNREVAEIKLGKAEEELNQYRELVPRLQEKAEKLAIMVGDLRKARAEMGEIGDQFFSKYAEIKKHGELERQVQKEAVNQRVEVFENIIKSVAKGVKVDDIPEKSLERGNKDKGLSR